MGRPFRLLLMGEGARLLGPAGAVALERRCALMLSYLALSGPTSRERMAGLLWPDREQSRARANLRQTLHRLRAAAPVVAGDPICLTDAVEVDLLHASEDELADSGVRLLDGIDASDLPEIEEWLELERERLQVRVAARLAEKLEAHKRAGELELAIATARRLVAHDPLSEAPYRGLMSLQLEQGDWGGALETYRRCREMLERSFGGVPDERTQALARRAAEATAVGMQRAALLDGRPATAGLLRSLEPVAHRAESGGWLTEGAALLRAASTTVEDPAARGRLLVDLAWLEHQLGRHDAAQRAAEEGVSLLRRSSAASRLPEGLFVLGSLARHRGDEEAARSLWSEALAFSDAGSGSPVLLLNLGMVEDALGNPGAARRHYLDALADAEGRRDRRTAAVALNNLGHLLGHEGRCVDARPLILRGLAFAEELGDRQLQGYLLDSLSRIELIAGDPGRARALAARALEISRAVGDLPLHVYALLSFASAQAALGAGGAAEAAARAALRAAWQARYLPGTRHALVVLAEIWGPEDARSLDTLEVIAAETGGSREESERARRNLVAWSRPSGGQRAHLDLESLVAMTLS